MSSPALLIPRRWIPLGIYLVLLLAHHLWAVLDPVPSRPEPEPGQEDVLLAERTGTEVLEGSEVALAYRDEGPRDAPVLLLVHGSPGSSHDFDQVLPHLPEGLRVIVPDLPGFGRSERSVADYSFRAHAAYLVAFLDRLGVEEVHAVGFSMGGGVVLELERQAPERIASVVMLSALGVQEFELLGSYEVNHALHGAQLALVWSLQNLLPHFGLLDDVILDVPFARNFYDSDQRPLRRVLERLEDPLLVIHGHDDFLVPHEAAAEHARIVPQAETAVVPDAAHFLVWTHETRVADLLAAWVARVESGDAPRRADATPERIAASEVPLEEVRDLRATGFTRWLLLVLIVFGTFVSEDATSIGTGLLIAQGRLGLAEGLGAVFLGIYFGDLLLYAFGRGLGLTVLRWPPWSWLIDEEDLRRAAAWFERRGFWAILLTRFVPGSRLPTYVAAGVVRTGFWRFAAYFLVAVLVWTPLLVGFAVLVGQEALERFEQARQGSLWWMLGLVVLLTVVVRLLVPLVRWKGRRLARARWIRMRRWEYWPSWILYLPVVAHCMGLARRHGSWMVPTAANPAMPAGGVVGESKADILAAFGDDPRIARFALLPADEEVDDRLRRIDRFLDRHGLDLPVVLKPDAGQRGEGVVVVRRVEDLPGLLRGRPIDLLVQEFVPGLEFGVFYAREGEEPGRIISLTEKRPLILEADGEHSLEDLILRDERALPLAERHLARHVDRLDEVFPAGERVMVAELGTHARGALFSDARADLTPRLTAAIDDLSRRCEGFRFGRYDVRVPSREALHRGEGLRVLEVNGLTSESTHMYDARYGYGDAVGILRRQWDLAFRVGAEQAARGAHVATFREIVVEWWRHRRRRRFHAEDRVLSLRGPERG